MGQSIIIYDYNHHLIHHHHHHHHQNHLASVLLMAEFHIALVSSPAPAPMLWLTSKAVIFIIIIIWSLVLIITIMVWIDMLMLMVTIIESYSGSHRKLWSDWFKAKLLSGSVIIQSCRHLVHHHLTIDMPMVLIVKLCFMLWFASKAVMIFTIFIGLISSFLADIITIIGWYYHDKENTGLEISVSFILNGLLANEVQH